jgi:hypothetical protein
MVSVSHRLRSAPGFLSLKAVNATDAYASADQVLMIEKRLRRYKSL